MRTKKGLYSIFFFSIVFLISCTKEDSLEIQPTAPSITTPDDSSTLGDEFLEADLLKTTGKPNSFYELPKWNQITPSKSTIIKLKNSTKTKITIKSMEVTGDTQNFSVDKGQHCDLLSAMAYGLVLTSKRTTAPTASGDIIVNYERQGKNQQTLVIHVEISFRIPTLIAANASATPTVRIIDLTNSSIKTFTAYDPNFSGGVRLATGDVNGDGTIDIITAAGPTGGPHVKAFNPITQTEIASFFAFDASYSKGVHLDSCELNGDGRSDILAAGVIPQGINVRMFSAGNLQLLGETYTMDPWGAGPGFIGGDPVPEIRNNAIVCAEDPTRPGKKIFITSQPSPKYPTYALFPVVDYETKQRIKYAQPQFLPTNSSKAAEFSMVVMGKNIAIASLQDIFAPIVYIYSLTDFSFIKQIAVFPATEVGPLSLSKTDFNNDGQPDLVVSKLNSSKIVIIDINSSEVLYSTSFSDSPSIGAYVSGY